MNRKFLTIAALSSVLLGLGTALYAKDTGRIPVPIFTEAGVQAGITYNSTTGLYTYGYTITNPAANTGEIWNIDIDIRLPRGGKALSSEGLVIPHGFITDSFHESVAIFKRDFFHGPGRNSCSFRMGWGCGSSGSCWFLLWHKDPPWRDKSRI